MKVLVVDDSLFARTNVCATLRDAGFETVEACNGREGLDKVVSERPGCVFTDLLMPEMDGISLLAAIRRHDASLPVFVLTADIQDAKRRQCMELGVAGFLSKPLKKQELLQAVSVLRPGESS